MDTEFAKLRLRFSNNASRCGVTFNEGERFLTISALKWRYSTASIYALRLYVLGVVVNFEVSSLRKLGAR